ncbi:hypothetical protein [Govanella unica]|uniref:Uncharacterized protein n=1 Tax=Govanella unica TaxID=2975056 RepID=A0A9X3Z7G6_9PROT|nr:hypothetical protein [Govania unica]MDA5193954.1 hypothetical protein [Govania unica]
MSKILQSLPLTIVAGVVLTVIMVFATDRLTKSASELPPAVDAAGDTTNQLAH